MVEQLTLNQLVGGSSPSRCTKDDRAARRAALFLSDEFEEDGALQRYYALMGTIAFMDGARTPVGKRFLDDNAPIFA
jgi:hypothetical protein